MELFTCVLSSEKPVGPPALGKTDNYGLSVIALISRGQIWHTTHTQSAKLSQEHGEGEIADSLCRTIVLRRQRPLRKKYTWFVQSISPASPASAIRARTSPPMSAGEIVFSSTKITLPWDRSASTQSFSNGGIVLRS
jgi:hypothetical protein